MLPDAQASWTPSVVHVKFGICRGTQPPWRQTSPVGQVPPEPQSGTQWFCEQTVPAGQRLGFDSHGVGLPVQTPALAESSMLVHEYPVGHEAAPPSVEAWQAGVHAPWTHLSPEGHCVPS